MRLRDTHSKKAHSLIGLGAALLGVALGVGVVYWDGVNDQPAAYAQGGSCQQEEQACVGKGTPYPTCHQKWVACMQKCMVGGGAVGQCNQDPECQSSCTESATSQGGKISCCEGGPKHGNACKDKVDGQCNPKQTELGKGMMPMMMMPMMGMMGMPPMLPMIPMGMPKMMMPMPPQEECQKEPKPEYCKTGVSDSLLGSLTQNVKDFFSPGSTETGDQQSIGDKLQSFLSGSSGSAESNASAGTNNPTQAVVTPVVSGSNAGGLSPQGGMQSGNTSGSQGQNVNAGVTGFGSAQGSATANAGWLTQVSQTLSGIKAALSNMFGSIF